MPAAPTPAPPPGDRPAVLVVDDEAAILFALGDYLREAGWQVETARTAERARELLATRRFAVAVIDLRLSADDEQAGLALAREVRRGWPRTRVVLLTAYGSHAVEEEARRLGVDSLLAKPQPLARLEEHLRELVDGVATRR